jgi:hypothetical protein
MYPLSGDDKGIEGSELCNYQCQVYYAIYSWLCYLVYLPSLLEPSSPRSSPFERASKYLRKFTTVIFSSVVPSYKNTKAKSQMRK